MVTSRRVRNNRLADPLHQQAFSALTCSPGARAYYDRIRARGAPHHAALRQLANRLVGILHGCLATRTCYDERKAWQQSDDIDRMNPPPADLSTGETARVHGPGPVWNSVSVLGIRW